MIKKLTTVLILIIAVLLIACNGPVRSSVAVSPPAAKPTSLAEPIQIKTAGYSDNVMGIVPQLPVSAKSADAFVPDKWMLLDSVEFDYNGDGTTDIVGVLNTISKEYEEYSRNSYIWYPRILFAARQTPDGDYLLDFQDINLIRTRDEGGMFDPYQPLTFKNNSFTINAFGGSGWKWNELTTFEYRDNDWYLGEETIENYYGPVDTSSSCNNYLTGVGKRCLNNEDSENLDILFEHREKRFELEFDVKLDAAPTLYQVSQRWWLASERLPDPYINAITTERGIDLTPSDITVLFPNLTLSRKYMDESKIVYTFQNNDNEYLVVYNRKTRIFNVILQSSVGYDNVKINNDTLYFSEKIYASFKQKRNDKITEEPNCIYTQIVQTNLDGIGRKVLFRYDNEYAEGEVLEESLPYISVSCEPYKNELIIDLYRGNAPRRYYRMNPDGTNLQFIGELKGFYDTQP